MKIYYCDDAPTPWGDWGVALVRGSLAWDEDTDIRSIERVGPFTPPAYICSGAFILTHPIKEALESSDLTGISRYQHLEKTHIVRIDWQHWDDSKPITQYLDLDGGPSSIIDQCGGIHVHCHPHEKISGHVRDSARLAGLIWMI